MSEYKILVYLKYNRVIFYMTLKESVKRKQKKKKCFYLIVLEIHQIY